MTENELRQKVCDQARYWLGRKEADGSHKEIIDAYNKIPLPGGYKLSYQDPWCAGFVSAVGFACGLSDIIYPDCNCDAMINKYRTAGRWMEDDAYVPKPGDVIFYDWDDNGRGDNTGSSDHVGLVLSATGRTVSVIEGNTSDMVAIRTRTVDQVYIRGYGLPDYARKAGAAEDSAPDVSGPDSQETVTLPKPPKGWYYVPLPMLQIGDGGTDSELEEAVRAAQYLLTGRGFSCGFWGCDGDFGRKTESAVGQFQADRQIERDGIIGPETWGKLICD